MTIPTRNEFIASARAYLGATFEHQGRGPKVDCLGLLVCAARDLGISIEDNLRYHRSPDYAEMRAGLLNHMDVISFYDAQPGDVLWIKWPRAAYPMHLAIVTEAGRVLHADGSPKIKKVVEHGLPSSWAGYVASTLRWNIWVNG